MPPSAYCLISPFSPGLQAPEYQQQTAARLPLQISLSPSPLCPHCPAADRIYLWKGAREPPANTIPDPTLRLLADRALLSAFSDSVSYGSALRKFHLFCDIFHVPEEHRLPATFPVLYSFAVWVSSDPDGSDSRLADGTPYEPVAVRTAKKYLSGVRAWHIVQGWPPPLQPVDFERIQLALRGLARLEGSTRSRPPRPPVTLHMLQALQALLDPSDSFDRSVWAIATCAFWGLMRFGECTVPSRTAYHPAKHPTTSNLFLLTDSHNRPYAKILLPSAKTAAPGDTQEIILAQQSAFCPLEALHALSYGNRQAWLLAPRSPLFSWVDSHGACRPTTKTSALRRINSLLQQAGFDCAYGHSFRIGGASYFLSKGVDPEIVRLTGRWRSLAYQLYIRSFELVVNRHIGSIQDRS